MPETLELKTNRSINRVDLMNTQKGIATLFLHGFSGSADTWFEITSKFNGYSITPDIIGHGKSKYINLNADYNINDWCTDMNEILKLLNVNRLNICGYSMGGRLAVAFAAKHPKKINSLMVEGGNIGIKDKIAREDRCKADLKLSKFISEDLEKFINLWESNPLFKSQKKRNHEAFMLQRNIRLSQNAPQLSKALKTFSQGSMDYFEEEFSKFDFPISIINGSEDTKYISTGRNMTKINSNCTHHIIEKSNHNVHLESPEIFLKLANNTFI